MVEPQPRQSEISPAHHAIEQRVDLNAEMSAEIAGLSDPGCVRQNNEDRIGIFALPGNGALLVVADGMGGHAAGEVAAQMALDAMNQTFAARPGADTLELLHQALETANARIYLQGQENPSQRGMGTTLTVLALNGGSAWFVHVGDSRLYRLRGGRLQQLSEDHSLVAEMVRTGLLSPKEAAEHPCRNVIVRALGSDPLVEPHIPRSALPLRAGDVFLLCSDGLHDLIGAAELSARLDSAPPDACRSLVELARERGGPDNISAVVCRVLKPDAKS